MDDPAHRHGGPDAGWYVPGPDGWQRISDGEVWDHGDAAHFMSDPNGRHAAMADREQFAEAPRPESPVPEMTDAAASEAMAAAYEPSLFASGGIIPQGSLRFGDRVQVYADGVLYCTHAIITDHGNHPQP